MSLAFAWEASPGRKSENSPRIRGVSAPSPFPDPHSWGVAGFSVLFTFLHLWL